MDGGGQSPQQELAGAIGNGSSQSFQSSMNVHPSLYDGQLARPPNSGLLQQQQMLQHSSNTYAHSNNAPPFFNINSASPFINSSHNNSPFLHSPVHGGAHSPFYAVTNHAVPRNTMLPYPIVSPHGGPSVSPSSLANYFHLQMPYPQHPPPCNHLTRPPHPFTSRRVQQCAPYSSAIPTDSNSSNMMSQHFAPPATASAASDWAAAAATSTHSLPSDSHHHQFTINNAPIAGSSSSSPPIATTNQQSFAATIWAPPLSPFRLQRPLTRAAHTASAVRSAIAMSASSTSSSSPSAVVTRGVAGLPSGVTSATPFSTVGGNSHEPLSSRGSEHALMQLSGSPTFASASLSREFRAPKSHRLRRDASMQSPSGKCEEHHTPSTEQPYVTGPSAEPFATEQQQPATTTSTMQQLNSNCATISSNSNIGKKALGGPPLVASRAAVPHRPLMAPRGPVGSGARSPAATVGGGMMFVGRPSALSASSSSSDDSCYEITPPSNVRTLPHTATTFKNHMPGAARGTSNVRIGAAAEASPPHVISSGGSSVDGRGAVGGRTACQSREVPEPQQQLWMMHGTPRRSELVEGWGSATWRRSRDSGKRNNVGGSSKVVIVRSEKRELKRKSRERLKVLFAELGPRISLADFEIGITVGTGTFGRVQIAKLRSDRQRTPLALKRMRKRDLIALKQVAHVRAECSILSTIDHPFIVNLLHSFQDRLHLFVVMEFVGGGELFSYMRRVQRLVESHAVFYAAEITLALSHLHERRILYRDLKPENVLIDVDGHLKLTDFGFAKVVEDRTWTLCGTPEYLAPEIIQSRGHGCGADWWSLGILLFEMLCGFPPFYDDTPLGIYQKIIAGRYTFPRHVSPRAQHLIRRLLTHDRAQRYGCLKNGALDIMNHQFFSEVDWQACLACDMTPPWRPHVHSDDDTSHFDFYPEADDQAASIDFAMQDLFRDF